MKRMFFTLALAVLVTGLVYGNKNEYEIPLIGAKAPSFSAKSTDGKLKFPNDFGKSWKILFSHPRDFTPVCTTELLELAYKQGEFEKLGVKLAVISTDLLSQHEMWKAHLEEINYKDRGTVEINFPLIEDNEAIYSRMYGMIHEPTSTTRDVRGVFIIDPDNIVRTINFYPMEVGRSTDEIIRLVQALQTTVKTDYFTPANWEKGNDVIVPHFPYKKHEVEADPSIKDNFYQVGNRVWFKKAETLE